MNKLEQIVVDAAQELLQAVVSAVLASEVGEWVPESPAGVPGEHEETTGGSVASGGVVYWMREKKFSLAFMPDATIRRYTRHRDLKYKMKLRGYPAVELSPSDTYHGDALLAQKCLLEARYNA